MHPLSGVNILNGTPYLSTLARSLLDLIDHKNAGFGALLLTMSLRLMLITPRS